MNNSIIKNLMKELEQCHQSNQKEMRIPKDKAKDIHLALSNLLLYNSELVVENQAKELLIQKFKDK